jgi:FG-GAP-like repeat/FG-GAP repeat
MRKLAAVTASAVLICGSPPASAQFAQQGPKLVGTGAIGVAGGALQGWSVALSSDGNTALVGGPDDNLQNDHATGAAWVFTRSNGAWIQQGQKLVGTGASANSQQGWSVALSGDGNTALIAGPSDRTAWAFTRSNGVWTQQAQLFNASGAVSVTLSADGNTAVIGAPGDNVEVGAAWVFTRSNGVWTQGQKLAANDEAGQAQFGTAVALSADGNTVIVGGPNDNFATMGAAWVFTLSNGIWTQQGPKLIGTGANFVDGIGIFQGYSVALSADGNTALIGGPQDSPGGAAWVFTRNNGVWTQQGQKLIGNGASANSGQGWSVALSGDGNTALIGEPGDPVFIINDFYAVGATWVFARSNGVWTQQGQKLVGTGYLFGSNQGNAVALSGDGNTALIGGPLDNDPPSLTGAAWVFAQPPKADKTNTHDFNGDGKSDIAWRDSSGNAAVWLMNGAQVLQAGGVGTADPNVWTIIGQRDFNGDGGYDWLWRDTSGNVAMWFLNGTQVTRSAGVGNVPGAWSVLGTGDFNGDGMGDILWQNTTSGDVAIWLMNGAQVTHAAGVGNAPPSVWKIVGTGDFNGDGKSDILWQDTSGNVAIWLMNGTQVTGAVGIGTVPRSVWKVVGTGDFNGDGKSDILWQDTSGNVAIWLMNGAEVTQAAGVGNAPPAVWSIVETGDFDGNGKSDLLWQDTSGNVAIWFMNGVQVAQSAGVGNAPIAVWTIQGANAD